jgi:hypothetical protein
MSEASSNSHVCLLCTAALFNALRCLARLSATTRSVNLMAEGEGRLTLSDLLGDKPLPSIAQLIVLGLDLFSNPL